MSVSSLRKPERAQLLLVQRERVLAWVGSCLDQGDPQVVSLLQGFCLSSPAEGFIFLCPRHTFSKQQCTPHGPLKPSSLTLIIIVFTGKICNFTNLLMSGILFIYWSTMRFYEKHEKKWYQLCLWVFSLKCTSEHISPANCPRWECFLIKPHHYRGGNAWNSVCICYKTYHVMDFWLISMISQTELSHM